MKISHFSVDQPVAILMFILVGVFLGWISLAGIPIDLFPELDFPFVTVSTTYSDVAPQEIESLVTQRIEEAVASVENVKNIHSISQEGLSLVMVEFEWGTDLFEAKMDVRETVDRSRPLLPNEAEDPVVGSFTIMGEQGAVRLSLTSDTRDLDFVHRLADKTLKPRLERIEGVASADILGGLEREIHVWVDPVALKAYGLTPDSVANVLGAENINRPGGRVTQGRYEYLVRTLGKFAQVQDLARVVVGRRGAEPVYLTDVALVEDGYSEVRDLARFNGKDAVEVVIRKESGGNTVQISDDVHAALELLRRSYPDVEMAVSFDTATFIKDSIQMVKENAIYGALLAGLVIFLFLWNVPATAVILISIPVSVFWTFVLVKFSGTTFNLMSLGGLALGVGMLVDNSILVLENIYRHHSFTPDPKDAAKMATGEIMLAVTASTFTTLAVFLPILWIEGIAKEIFTDFSLTVAFSLASSLVVAFTVVPMLGSRMLRRGQEVGFDLTDNVRTLGRFSDGYMASVKWALAHYRSVILTAIALFAFSLFGFVKLVGQEFFPKMNEDTFNVSLKMPVGYSLTETDAVSREVEAAAMADPEVIGVLAEVKPGRVDYGVTLMRARQRETAAVIADLRGKLTGLPDAEILFREHGPGGGGSQVQVELSGEDLDELRRQASRVKEEVSRVDGTVDVTTTVEEGRPELTVKVDRVKLADRGLRVVDVSGILETAVAGRVSAKLDRSGDEIDIRVQLPPDARRDEEGLRSVPVAYVDGAPLLVGDVAAVQNARGPLTIDRKNQRRVVSVGADKMPERDLRSVIEAVKGRMTTVSLPEGYEWDMEGEAKSLQEAFSALGKSLAIALVLVYMVMAAQFGSLIHPFTMMFTMPFSIIGVFLALWVTGTAFSVPAFVGLIMLAGIVVNNAIILLDFVIRMRAQGKPMEQALVEAGSIRLRPILMTTLTTVIGMLPMALGLGAGAAFYVPLAITVIGGLSMSTLLTLIVIPCMYLAVERLRDRSRTLILRMRRK